MKRTALIFDLDGTLAHTLPDLRAALNHALAGNGCRELSMDEVRGMIGDGTRALVQRGLTATGSSMPLDQAHQRFLDFYEAEPTKLTRLYPGVIETLEALREGGARLAVCTNKHQAATVTVLARLSIVGYFEVVLCGDMVPMRKPDPRHLLATLERLGASAGEAAMIGDNENDYGAARAAGLPVILMRYGYLRVSPDTMTPDAWLDNFADIPRTLATLKD